MILILRTFNRTIRENHAKTNPHITMIHSINSSSQMTLKTEDHMEYLLNPHFQVLLDLWPKLKEFMNIRVFKKNRSILRNHQDKGTNGKKILDFKKATLGLLMLRVKKYRLMLKVEAN